MPKGRGANERRRDWRQKHPSDKSTEVGAANLQKLGERAVKVQEKRRKERG